MPKNKNLNKYQELSFLNQHVDTFYVGLNGNNNQAINPLQARVVRLDDTNADESIVKNWVQPDSQLVKSCGKTSTKLVKKSGKPTYQLTNIIDKSPTKRHSHRYKPLKFVADNVEKKTSNNATSNSKKPTKITNACKTVAAVNNEKNSTITEQNENNHDENANFNVNEVENNNETLIHGETATILLNEETDEPNKENKQSILKRLYNTSPTIESTPPPPAKILAPDTPEQYYGLLIIQRRKLGLNF